LGLEKGKVKDQVRILNNNKQEIEINSVIEEELIDLPM